MFLCGSQLCMYHTKIYRLKNGIELERNAYHLLHSCRLCACCSTRITAHSLEFTLNKRRELNIENRTLKEETLVMVTDRKLTIVNLFMMCECSKVYVSNLDIAFLHRFLHFLTFVLLE